MRLFLSIIVPFFCFRCLAVTQVLYRTFEIGLGYRDEGWFYGGHGIGQYITLPADKVPANWDIRDFGNETIISGTKDVQTLSPYVCLIYRDNLIVFDTSSDLDNPIVQGSPYTGGPITARDGNFIDISGKTPTPAGKVPTARTLPPGSGGNNGDGGFNEVTIMLNDFFISDLVDSDGNYSGSDLYRLGEAGDDYVLYDMSGNAVSRWSKSLGESCPIQYKDSSGNMKVGWYNPATGKISATRPNSDGTQSDFQVVVNSIDGVKQNQDLLRQQLIAQLGAAGNSWVYDCKLSLAQLETLATSLGINISSINDALYDANGSLISKLESHRRDLLSSATTLNTRLINIYSRQNTINTSINGVNTSVGAVKSSVDNVNSSLAGIKNSVDGLSDYTTVLEQIRDKLPDETSNLPSIPSPDLSNEPSPDSSLPFTYNSFASDSSQVFSLLNSLGSDPANGVFARTSFFVGLLQVMVGPIPSVASDPVMFSVDFYIPYIGHVSKTFSFADWPIVLVFREVACWAVVLFFGLASFKLVHRSII